MLKEQEDEWEEYRGLIKWLRGDVKLENEDVKVVGSFLGYYKSNFPDVKHYIQLLTSSGIITFTTEYNDTYKLYKRKSKRETVKLNGKVYYKDELEQALSNLKEVED